ncbi:hypothetical protein [Lysobacter sp. CA199]|uniref:hypothetical protein n=1 Tax=Lysobacter sp. CA199 TaxID=3455608 RepID=UPI003F8D3553
MIRLSFPRWLSLPVAALLAACSSSATSPAATATPQALPDTLSATLTAPTDIVVAWTRKDTGAAGRVIEFATEPQGHFTILKFMPLHEARFDHNELIPHTTFYYRLRPYYGPASNEITLTLPPGDFNEKDQSRDHQWAPPRHAPQAPTTQFSVRGTAPAGPHDLKATVMHANGIHFTWTDRANDEDANLLEVRPQNSADFHTAALLDPDTNSFGLITMPDEKTATYRVRPIYYTAASDVVHQTTGAAPWERAETPTRAETPRP